MSDDSKIIKIGAKAAPAALSVATLAKFAESIIRSDKEAAMRSQQGLDDLMTPSQDSRTPKAVRTSSIEALCGKTGGVRLQKSDEDSTPAPDNLVAFAPRKKD